MISISGEHDLNTAPELRAELAGLTGSDAGILIDLSPAAFIDSSILGVILDARRQAKESGVVFEVVHDGSNAAVGRVLEITGLCEELPVHASLDGATAAG